MCFQARIPKAILDAKKQQQYESDTKPVTDDSSTSFHTNQSYDCHTTELSTHDQYTCQDSHRENETKSKVSNSDSRMPLFSVKKDTLQSGIDRIIKREPVLETLEKCLRLSALNCPRVSVVKLDPARISEHMRTTPPRTSQSGGDRTAWPTATPIHWSTQQLKKLTVTLDRVVVNQQRKPVAENNDVACTHAERPNKRKASVSDSSCCSQGSEVSSADDDDDNDDDGSSKGSWAQKEKVRLSAS